MQPRPEPRDRFLAALRESFDGRFVRLVLSAPKAGDAESRALAPRRITARRVKLRGGDALSCVLSFATRDETRNVPLQDAPEELARWLGAPFAIATLLTTDTEHELRLAKDGWRLTRRAAARAPEAATHDRAKERLLGPRATAYLQPLGVTDAEGRPRAGLEHKLRQIHRYVEILDGLLRRLHLRDGEPLRVVDVGAGKGYLTFALYDHLTGGLGLRAEVLGVEARPELCEAGNALAARVGFTGLRFAHGLAAEAALGEPDVLVALHACDTATDDALYRGLRARARLIVTAPCCHKELRPQLHAADPGLGAVLEHGILAAREADLVTDGVRALLLRAQGYDADVFEFIDAEHTAKNLMIAAVRTPRAELPRAEDPEAAAAQERLRALRALFGWRTQKLQALLESAPASS